MNERDQSASKGATQENIGAGDARVPRRAYSSPRIKDYGNVAQLTAGASGMGFDGGGGMVFG